MKELALKYGCNPHQKPARVYMKEGSLPFSILNGKASYINLLDALNSWQLVKELKEATRLAAAASFKHTSPAGAAVGVPLSDTLKKAYFVEEDEFSPIATAYIRARGADRMSSYGDFVALSEPCDAQTAAFLQREVSDGIIAPGYCKAALDILKTKRKGSYLIIQIAADYTPPAKETKMVFGVNFEQQRNDIIIKENCLQDVVTKNKTLSQSAKRDLLLALITLKYTQSNSVCYAKDGQAIGIGAGQQSRIHCTRLAGQKADIWHLRQSLQVLSLPFKSNISRPERDNAIDVYLSDEATDLLENDVWKRIFTEKPPLFSPQAKAAWLNTATDVALASDAFFPFGDNIERAHKSGVSYIAQTGGSIRDDHVIEIADKYNMFMAMTHIRLFHH